MNKQDMKLAAPLIASNLDVLATLGTVAVETLAKLAKGGSIPKKLDNHKIASKFIRNTILTDVVTTLKKGEK